VRGGEEEQVSGLSFEEFQRIVRLMEQDHGRPEVEYHHPLCPKILMGMPCRCGGAPLEAELARELGAKAVAALYDNAPATPETDCAGD
jgi:hypothetical protein